MSSFVDDTIRIALAANYTQLVKRLFLLFLRVRRWLVLGLLATCGGCAESLHDDGAAFEVRNGCVLGEPIFIYPNHFDRVEQAGTVSLFDSGDFGMQEVGGIQVPLPLQPQIEIEEIESEMFGDFVRARQVVGPTWTILIISDVESSLALSLVQHVREWVGSATYSPLVPQFLDYLDDASGACNVPVDRAPALASMRNVLITEGAETLRMYRVKEMPAFLLERVFQDTRVRLELVLDDPRNPDALVRVRIYGSETAELLKRLIENRLSTVAE
jgi:hypothetical protein